MSSTKRSSSSASDANGKEEKPTASASESLEKSPLKKSQRTSSSSTPRLANTIKRDKTPNKKSTEENKKGEDNAPQQHSEAITKPIPKARLHPDSFHRLTLGSTKPPSDTTATEVPNRNTFVARPAPRFQKVKLPALPQKDRGQRYAQGVENNFSLAFGNASKLSMKADPFILELIHTTLNEVIHAAVHFGEECRRYRNELFQFQRKPVEKMFVPSSLSFQHVLEDMQDYVDVVQFPSVGQVAVPMGDKIHVYGSFPFRHLCVMHPSYPPPQPLIRKIHSITADDVAHRIYALHENGTVRVWNLIRACMETEFQVFPYERASALPPFRIMFLHDHCLLVNLSWMDGHIWIFEPVIGRVIRRISLQIPRHLHDGSVEKPIHTIKFLDDTELFFVTFDGVPNIFVCNLIDSTLRAILVANIGTTPCFTYSSKMKAVMAASQFKKKPYSTDLPFENGIAYWNLGSCLDYIRWNKSAIVVQEDLFNPLNQPATSVTYLQECNLFVTASADRYIRFYEHSSLYLSRKKQMIVTPPKYYEELYPSAKETSNQPTLVCVLEIKSDFNFGILDVFETPASSTETVIALSGSPFNLSSWVIGKSTVEVSRHLFDRPVSWRTYIDEKRPLLHQWGQSQRAFHENVPALIRDLEAKFDQYDRLKDQILFELESFYTRAGISAIPQKEIHLSNTYELALQFPRRRMVTGKPQSLLTTDEVYAILSEVFATDRTAVEFLNMCKTKPLDVTIKLTDPFNAATAELVTRDGKEEWERLHIHELATVFISSEDFIEIADRLEFFTRFCQSIERLKRNLEFTLFPKGIVGLQRIFFRINFAKIRADLDSFLATISDLKSQVYKYLLLNKVGKKGLLNINIRRSLTCSEDRLEFDDPHTLLPRDMQVDQEIPMLFDGARRSYLGLLDDRSYILTIVSGASLEEELESGYNYLHHFRRELYLLRSLGRPYYLDFLGAIPDSTPLSQSLKGVSTNIRMVFNENLEDYITLSTLMKLCGRFSFGDRYYVTKYWAHHVLSALDRFHSLGGILRGIKPDRILISPDGKEICFTSIRDFAYTDEDGVVHASILAHDPGDAYAPPESFFSQKGIGTSYDVWMFGALLFEMMFGQPPKACFTAEERTRYQHDAGDPTALRRLKTSYDPFEGWQNTKVVTKKEGTTEDSKTLLVCYPNPDSFLDGVFDPEESLEYVMDFIVKEGSSTSIQEIIRRCMVLNPDDRIKMSDLLKHPSLCITDVVQSSATETIERMMDSLNTYRAADKIIGDDARQLMEMWMQKQELCYSSVASMTRKICDIIETHPISPMNSMIEYSIEEKAMLIELIFHHRLIDCLIIASMRVFREKKPGSESCMDSIIYLIDFFVYELSKSHGGFRDIVGDILVFFLRLITGDEGDYLKACNRFVTEPILIESHSVQLEWMQLFHVVIGRGDCVTKARYWASIGGPNWSLTLHKRITPIYQRLLGEDSLGHIHLPTVRDFLAADAFKQIDSSCCRTREYFRELRMMCENIPRVLCTLKSSTRTSMHTAVHYFYNVIKKNTPDISQLFLDLRILQKLMRLLTLDDEYILSEVMNIFLELARQSSTIPWSFSHDVLVSCFEQPAFQNLLIDMIWRASCPMSCRVHAVIVLQKCCQLTEKSINISLQIDVFPRLFPLLPTVQHWTKQKRGSNGLYTPLESAVLNLFSILHQPPNIHIERYIRTNSHMANLLRSKQVAVAPLISSHSLELHVDEIMLIFSQPNPTLGEREFQVVRRFIQELRLFLDCADYIEDAERCNLTDSPTLEQASTIIHRLLIFFWNRTRQLGPVSIENRYSVEQTTELVKDLLQVVELFVDGTYSYVEMFARGGIIGEIIRQFGNPEAYSGASSHYGDIYRRFRLLTVKVMNSKEKPICDIMGAVSWDRVVFEDLKREHDYLRKTKLDRDTDSLQRYQNRAMSRAQLLSFIFEQSNPIWLKGLSTGEFIHYVVVDGMSDTTSFDSAICSQFPSGKFGRYLIRNDCYMIFKHMQQHRKLSKEAVACFENAVDKMKEHRVWSREMEAIRRWQDDRHYAIVSVCIFLDLLDSGDSDLLTRMISSGVIDVITAMYFELRLWYQNVRSSGPFISHIHSIGRLLVFGCILWLVANAMDAWWMSCLSLARMQSFSTMSEIG
eukprot:TRINITY_DN3486_c0_g4_i1.p1 TRINITY_DN3486_c0_g4~~TRINITY_DN3486_c0_g4_i1.p1  ORF type:complete len:2138 (+),score=291.15 TRINITY_DN3486_c0_g4_i1:97-6510(+)